MRSIYSLYIIVIVFTILIILIGYAFSNNLAVLEQKSQEEDTLKQIYARLQNSNEQARYNIEVLQDESILQTEARKQFNLKKEGEEVVVIYPSEQENRREPLSDEQFLDLYQRYQEEQQKQQLKLQEQQATSFINTVRNILDHVIGGRDVDIKEIEPNDQDI